MFPKLKGTLLRPAEDVEKGLNELGSRMTDNDEPVKKEASPSWRRLDTLPWAVHRSRPYFDLTPLASAGKVDVDQMRNFRTPFLDLDQVYGGGRTYRHFCTEKVTIARSGFSSEKPLVRELLTMTCRVTLKARR